MASASPTTCYFVDTSIIIPEILGQNNQRILKFKTEVTNHRLDCYFPDSVGGETQGKINDTINFIGNTIKNCLITELQNYRTNLNIPLTTPISTNDVIVLENLFYGYHGIAKSKGTLTDPLDVIEQWVIIFISEKLEKGIKLTIDDLAKELVKNVLKIANNVQEAFDNLITLQKGFMKKIVLPRDSRFPSIIANLRGADIHQPDSDHIARAALHQILSGRKVIFVTLDFTTILNRRKSIFKAEELQCCDPLYAFHYK